MLKLNHLLSPWPLISKLILFCGAHIIYLHECFIIYSFASGRHLGITLDTPSSHQPVCSITLIIFSILYSFLFKVTTMVYREMALPWHPDDLACTQTGQVGKTWATANLNLGAMPCDPAARWKDGRLLKRCCGAVPFFCFAVSPRRLSWDRSCLVRVSLTVIQLNVDFLLVWITFCIQIRLSVSSLSSQYPPVIHTTAIVTSLNTALLLLLHCPQEVRIFIIDPQHTSPVLLLSHGHLCLHTIATLRPLCSVTCTSSERPRAFHAFASSVASTWNILSLLP